MSIEKVTVYTDGASRGNPGPAAAAFVVMVEGQVIAESGTTIGNATNNVAEYSALIRALEFVRDLGAKAVHVHSDSELMVKQLRGEYRVKHPDLIPFYEDATELAGGFASVEYTHVRRGENAEADRLCNEALDGHQTVATNWSPKATNSTCTKPSSDPVIDYLSEVRAAWADATRVEPTPADVWRHIQSLTKARKSAGSKRKSS